MGEKEGAKTVIYSVMNESIRFILRHLNPKNSRRHRQRCPICAQPSLRFPERVEAAPLRRVRGEYHSKLRGVCSPWGVR